MSKQEYTELNQQVADFEYMGGQYEIDMLMDSGPGMFGDYTYDIYDITDSDAVCIGNFQMDDFKYLTKYDVVKAAMFEIDRLDFESQREALPNQKGSEV